MCRRYIRSAVAVCVAGLNVWIGLLNVQPALLADPCSFAELNGEIANSNMCNQQSAGTCTSCSADGSGLGDVIDYAGVTIGRPIDPPSPEWPIPSEKTLVDCSTITRCSLQKAAFQTCVNGKCVGGAAGCWFGTYGAATTTKQYDFVSCD